MILPPPKKNKQKINENSIHVIYFVGKRGYRKAIK